MKITYSAARIIFLSFFFCFFFNNLFSQSTEWEKDLDIFKKELPKKHVNAFERLNKSSFHQSINELKKTSPHDTLEFAIRLQLIMAQLGDIHSFIGFKTVFKKEDELPVHYYVFEEGVFVTAASASLDKLSGNRIISINKEERTMYVDVANGKKQLGMGDIYYQQLLKELK